MTTAAPTAPAARNSALQSAIEKKNGIQFRLSAGGAKYICTIKDRHSHERQKAERTDSSESIDSGASTTSTTSESSAHASDASTPNQH